MTPQFKISVIVVLAALGLSGCLSPQGRLDPNYGVSVRQNIAAQIADPDARYRRDTPPAASGERAQIAHKRYNSGQVIPPSAPSASTIGEKSGGGAAPPPPSK